MAANGPSSSSGGGAEHPLEQPWQLYLHYPTFTQSLENYASEAYQARLACCCGCGVLWVVVGRGVGLVRNACGRLWVCGVWVAYPTDAPNTNPPT